ncbi:ribose-phosphate pyrophosphokinase [Fistulifera solaris]|uniref:Ribose-phosphate pyrophosphokinase 2 n=1 Tax=Fistulifera solaris TaxID=1519565 RepID=A0A1Z5JZU2_FISSO|nr:ribose-phosphate pyrophosphokinase [Fistulifera solaris]|eukprot:GAX19366.1 ribose-phosphate pyrophosphokinase [Fistulifera solaris]
MRWTQIATRQALRKVTESPRNRILAARAFGSQSENERVQSSWTMAAVFTASLAGAAAVTLCEDPAENFTFVRTYSKSGLADPLTTFAKYAQKKEHEERHSQQDEEKKQDVSVQATSTANGEGVDMAATASADTLSEGEAKIEAEARKLKQHSGGLKVFSGNGNMSLSLEIARHLGINLGKATVGRFADGEVNCVINENVRGKDVYIVQPTCPPVNDNIMELLLMISTLRRASARRITVVIPYYGYARQDRKMQARVPISAADVARLMEAMGVDRVIAVDLHCGQIQGFFGPRVPVDNLDGGIVGLDYFGCKDLHNPVVVSPDAGGVYRAKKFKEGLEQKYEMNDVGLAMIVKQRARAGAVDQMDLVGDVKDCDCILVDDMIDTAGTLCKAADVLIASGARRVFAFASHGLLSGPGNDRIANSNIEEVVILNTIPTSPQREANEKLTELSVAPLLAQAIFNIHAKKSISALFK